MTCSVLKSDLVGSECWFVPFALFTCFSRIRKVVCWPYSEPLSLMCCHESHDAAKSRFLLTVVLIRLPHLILSIPRSLAYDCYLKQPPETH